MKKYSLILLLASTCLILAGSFFLTKEPGLKDIVSENVEALASGEGSGGTLCMGSGSVDCLVYKVEIKISGF
ncbi:MAG: NVEALA domain-containing protein [Prevotella sp.]|jgi:hypothetical protein|nr:NVEALA domain-containing protein [Prevotella sp.]